MTPRLRLSRLSRPWWRALTLVLACAVSGALQAAAGDVLYSDGFEDGDISPWSDSGGGYADVTAATSGGGTYSLSLFGGTHTAVSPVIDAGVPAADLDVWIREDDGSIEEAPDGGDDLVLEYLDDAGNWQPLETFQGGGGRVNGVQSYELDPNALHAGFRVRARLTDGAFYGYDYWYIDDVTLTEREAAFIGTGTGLTGDYCNRGNGNYDTPCTNDPDVTRIDPTVDFSDGDANWPASGIDGDTFAVRWTGDIQAQYTDDYTFHALHDDGVRIWVNGTQVIDNYSDQDDAWTDSGAPISLQRGQRYSIVIEYYENGGDEDMTLAWSSPATPYRTTVPQTQLYPTSGPSANLLAEWRMDESGWSGSSGEVIDNSGNGLDGTAQGGATTAGINPAIPGDPGTCRYGTFDGNDDAISVSNLSDSLNGTATLTFWIRTTQTGSDTGYQAPGITGVEEAGGTDDIFWGWIDGSGRIGISVANDFEDEQKSTTAVNDGTWHHVALTRDAASGDTRVYIDGNLERTGSTGTGTIGTAFSSIGQIEDTGGGATPFEGDLDEVRIYDAPLSESEVDSIRQDTHPCTTGGAGLVAEYRMDESGWNGTVGEIQDTSGSGLDGTARTSGGDGSVPDTVPARVCNGGRFRGQGYNEPDGSYVDAQHYAEVPDADELSPLASTREMTISGWFRSNSGGGGTLLEKGAGYPTREYRIFLNGGQFRATVWGQNRDETANLSASVSAGNWYFFAMTASNPNGNRLQLALRMYDENGLIDSVSRSDNSFFSQFGSKPLTASLLFGATDYGSGPTDFIDGTLDEVRIHDRVLSDAELTGLRDRTRPCGPTVDHYAVVDPGQGLTCEALPVTIAARDANDNPVDPPAGTTIDVTAVIPGGTNPAPDTSWASSGSDQTSYTFGGGASSVTLQLRRTSTGTVNVNVDDGSATEIATTDPDIPFAETGFLFYADGTVNSIGNQIAVKSSNTAPGSQSLELRAVEDPNGPTPGAACEARFSDSQTIEMGFECTDPDNCSGSRQVAINGTGIPGNNAGAVSSYGNVSLDFGTNGSAPFQLSYTDAGEIRLHAREDLPASGDDPAVTLIGSSNPFVVRPFGFHVTAAGNPAATSATGADYQAAGTDFDVEIAAVGWAAGDDGDNDGVPDGYGNGDPTDNASLGDNVLLPNFGPESTNESATLTSTLWQPSGGNDPALAGTPTIDEAAFEDAGNAGAGSAGTTVRYPEVGIIELRAALDDGDYLDTGFDVPGRSVAVGRFIPADFNQTATDGMFRNTCAATFTYLGETFGYESGGLPELTITARNDQAQTTQNYTGAFAKLVAADVQRTGPADDGTTNGSDGTPLAVVPDLKQGALTDNGDGTLTYTFDTDDGYRYARNIDRDNDGVNDARVAPFDTDLKVTIDAIVDSDGVNAPAGNRDDVTPVPARIRFGRLVIENAAGAEIAPIEQVIRAEYFAGDVSGDQWDVNADDDGCTAFTLASPGHEIALANDDDGDSPVAGDGTIDIASGTTGIQETGPIALNSGTAVLTFTPPGAGNTAWLDTVARLGVEHPYLAIDDDGDGVWDANPTGRVTFGIYTGPAGRILLREVPAN